jgi:DNA-binding transcriptional MerR regulator
MSEASREGLPAKLYFRIGEVAELVGVEPHVLRYWEREFRAIRPTKSAKGQRVYSRRDVENLMRVRELLYREGFTIAGAKKRLQKAGVEPRGAGELDPREAAKLRDRLLAIRGEIEAFLDELEPPGR